MANKRLHEFAQEIGRDADEVKKTAIELGISAKTRATLLTEEEMEKIKAAYAVKSGGKTDAASKKGVIIGTRRKHKKAEPAVEAEAPAAAALSETEEKPETPAETEAPKVRRVKKAVEETPEAPKEEVPEVKPEVPAEKPEGPETKAVPAPAEVKESQADETPVKAEPEAAVPETPEEKPEKASPKARIKIVAKAAETTAKALEKAAKKVKGSAKNDEAAETSEKQEKPVKEAAAEPAAEEKPAKPARAEKQPKTKAEPKAEKQDAQAEKKPAGKPAKAEKQPEPKKQESGLKSKIKIVQRASEQKPQPTPVTDRRGKKGKKNAGQQPQEGKKPQESSRRRPAAPRSQDAPQPQPVENRSGRRGKKGHEKDDSRTKFDKFEKKSLEKKERKKYTKKPDVEEEIEEEILPEGTFKIDVPITIAGFCEQTEVSTSKVIMTLMKMGIMANINQNLDEETVMVLADEIGINVVVGNVEQMETEEGIEDFEDDEKDLKSRPPIITVMGHVDHGKTSLLDAIRSTNVTAQESGGITQHIGASEVSINGRKIVFLDTPGHEAFTAMRARGAHVTDIAVLVVAADDSVKPQTIESISHAKAAGVPIIVAINKMDKPGANPDMVKRDLADQGVLVEDWGGDVISVPVSAKTREGIEDLLEMILLEADVLELKANPDRLALGSVIEAKLDKARGPVATLLVLNGTLKAGQSIVAGTCSGRIRLMTDARGKQIRKAGPATAVEILGLTDVPQAGDVFNAVKDDKTAREIAARRSEKLREETMAKNSSMSLEKLFSQIQEGETKELNLIIKADVQGSVGALISSLEKLNNENVRVNVIHSGVGTVNESDIMLAETSNAVIIGFNVRPSAAVTQAADAKDVEIRLYRVIYDAINDVEAAMKGMLDPETKEEVLGQATVRETFRVPNVGTIAGSYVTSGKVVRNAEIRLVRDGIVIHEGKISSLKRFKDDQKEVNQGYECGIGIESYNDIKVDDVIECFRMVEVRPE